jgi:hypothetical protein
MQDKNDVPQVGRPRLFPVPRRVPEELRAWPNWVNWRAVGERRPEEIKYRKIPVDPKNGRNAKTNDSTTWASFDEAAAFWNKHQFSDGVPEKCAGIGVILGEVEGLHLVGMDFDNCVREGVLDADIAAIIAQLPGYAETSPSGNGVKVFWLTTVDLSGLTRAGLDAAGRGREFYCGSPRYFAVTGRPLKGRESVGEVVGPDWSEEVVAAAMADVVGATRSSAGPRLAAVGGTVVDPEFADESGGDPFARMSEKPRGWTLARVRKELLTQVSSDCGYEDWFRVACALHHHGDGGEEWFELFDVWSQGAGDRYPGEDGPNGTRAKWDSVGGRQRGAPVTLASLMKMAKAANAAVAQDAMAEIAGAPDEKTLREIADRLCHRDLDVFDRDKAAHALKKRFKDLGQSVAIAIARSMVKKAGPVAASSVLPWAAELVYVEDERRWYGPRGNSYTVDSLSATFGSKTPLLPPPVSGRISPVKYVSEDVGDHIPKARSRRFRPDVSTRLFEEHGEVYLNSFTEGMHRLPEMPVEYSAAARAGFRMIEDHLAWLLPVERERRLLWDSLCWMVQNPGKQLRWMPLLVGPVGAGKSFFEVLLRTVMTPEWVTVVGHDAFSGRFNGWAGDSLIVILSEVRFPSDASRYAMLDKLKPLLTDPYISVEAKGMDAYTARNTANYFAMSNHDDAIPLGEDTRRVLVLSVDLPDAEIEARGREGYFDRLFTILEAHPGALRRWMLEYGPDQWHEDFQPGVRAAQTQARQAMVEATEDPVVEEVREALDHGGDGFSREGVDLHRLAAHLSLSAGGSRPTRARVRHALRALGYKSHLEFQMKTGGRVIKPMVTSGGLEKFRKSPVDFRAELRNSWNSDFLGNHSED